MIGRADNLISCSNQKSRQIIHRFAGHPHINTNLEQGELAAWPRSRVLLRGAEADKGRGLKSRALKFLTPFSPPDG